MPYDELRIGYGCREENGTKVEPEEQPVDHSVSAQLPVTLGSKPGEGTQMQVTMRGAVTDQITAGAAVEKFSRQCHLCGHWDQQMYQRERPAYAPEELDEQRAAALDLASPAQLVGLAVQRADEILDASFGRCRALSHYSPDGRLDTHAQACCPSTVPGVGEIDSAFTPRRDARRDVTGIRDRILQTAAGRKP